MLAGIHWLIQNYNHKTILKIAAAFCAVLVVVLLIVPINRKEEYPADVVLKRGQHVFLGNYKEKPLKWIVLAYSKDGYLLWNEDAVEYMAKIWANIIVVFSNYFISKFWIFK